MINCERSGATGDCSQGVPLVLTPEGTTIEAAVSRSVEVSGPVVNQAAYTLVSPLPTVLNRMLGAGGGGVLVLPDVPLVLIPPPPGELVDGALVSGGNFCLQRWYSFTITIPPTTRTRQPMIHSPKSTLGLPVPFVEMSTWLDAGTAKSVKEGALVLTVAGAVEAAAELADVGNTAINAAKIKEVRM